MVFVAQAKDGLDPLERMQIDVERRRALDKQRKTRVFDAKVRTMGVDVKALDELVRDRQQREELERQRNLNFDKERLRDSRTLTELQRLRQRNICLRDMQDQRFRDQYQQKEQARDYDLSDPLLLRKTQPPRLGDEQVLPASSLQMFSGEDFSKNDRERRQRLQVKQWANETVDAKMKREDEEAKAEQEYANQVLKIDSELEKLQFEKATNIKGRNVETRLYNQNLANETASRRTAERKHEELVGQKEVEKLLNDDMLNENRSTTIRSEDTMLYTSSHHKYVPWHFKGYSKQERQNILDEQAKQMELNEHKKAVEKEEKEAWDQELLATRREVLKRERLRQRNRTQYNLDVATEQAKQKQAFKQKYDYINNVVYTNQVDDYIFNCFGTTTR